MSIQYEERLCFAVRCENEEDRECERGPWAGSRTAACDAAKAEGWAIDGNSRALCPDCDNAESNQEDPCEDEPNLPDLERDRMAEDRRMKR